MSDDINRSGGGIVFGGTGASASDPSDVAGVVRALRRRWMSGITIVLTRGGDDGYRGITATSFMVVSEEPPLVALAVAAEGEFGSFLATGTELTISLLDAEHEFLADRFAGRAPLPDRALRGIPHVLDGDLPVIAGALGWCRGWVTEIVPAGDHLLVIVEVIRGGLGRDTDDPLLRYEGRYRRLEAG